MLVTFIIAVFYLFMLGYASWKWIQLDFNEGPELIVPVLPHFTKIFIGVMAGVMTAVFYLRNSPKI